MRLILRERSKQTIAGMLAFFLLFYSCARIVTAEEHTINGCTHVETEQIGEIPASCENVGYTGDILCKVCKAVVQYGEQIQTLGHQWDEGKIEKAAGCETEGVIVYTCLNDTSHERTETIRATGHTILDYVCTNCGKKYGVIKFVPQGQATAGETLKVDVVLERNPGIASLKIEYKFDATCLELTKVENKSVLSGYKKAEDGNLIWENKNLTKNNLDTGVIATLTMKVADGFSGTTEMKAIGIDAFDINDKKEDFILLEGTSITVGCEHQWDDGVITKQPTCKENGEITYTCIKDKAHTWIEVLPKLGHDWDEGVTIRKASCEEEGIIVYTCLNDNTHTMREVEKALGHDYKIIEYKKPTLEEDGYEKYKCTRCEDEYEEIISKTGTDPEIKFEYDDASGATADSITFYVGYFGMGYVKKTTLSLSEIQNNCQMITQTYSYINRRPRVVYDVATGARVRDVLQLAGIDMASAQSYQLGTEDSAGNYYNATEITNSTLYSTRFFYPNLSKYFLEDGTFSNKLMASAGAQVVEPMLAIWDSWITYGVGQEFTMAEHSSNMRSGNCFRLLYGQNYIDEVSAVESAKWINTIYVRYTGAPSLDAGDDLDLSISSDHTLSANVSSVDKVLSEKFQDSIRWSSSDESVVKVDSVTGKITVVGEGSVKITASINIEGVSVSDSLTINVSADNDENLEGGGSGNGSGTGTGDGSGLGTGDGTGTGTENGEGDHSGDGTENGVGSDIGNGGNKVENAEQEQIEKKIEITEEEPSAKKIGRSISAVRLNLGDENDEEGGGVSGGRTGGGLSGEILLNLQSQTMWRWTALFAILMLLTGGASMYRKYRLEI